MYMGNEIINHMTANELRNYCCKVRDYAERACQARYASQEVVHACKQMINNMEYERDAVNAFKESQARLRRYEDELCKEYDEYLPKPVCTVEEVKE